VRQREYREVTEDKSSVSVHAGAVVSAQRFPDPSGARRRERRHDVGPRASHRIPDSATMSPRAEGLLVFPPPPTVLSAPDGGAWPCSGSGGGSTRPVSSARSGGRGNRRPGEGGSGLLPDPDGPAAPTPAVQPFTGDGVRHRSRSTVSRSADGRPTADEPANSPEPLLMRAPRSAAGPADPGLLGRGGRRDSGAACVAPTVTAPNAGSFDRSFLKIGLD
jgi:hypothetical protein